MERNTQVEAAIIIIIMLMLLKPNTLATSTIGRVCHDSGIPPSVKGIHHLWKVEEELPPSSRRPFWNEAFEESP